MIFKKLYFNCCFSTRDDKQLIPPLSSSPNRNSSGRENTRSLWRFIQPRSFRTSMTPSTLRSASVTTATSLTTPASLWPPPPSSAEPCLTVGQRSKVGLTAGFSGTSERCFILYKCYILCVRLQVATTTTSPGETLNLWWFCPLSGRISNPGSKLSTCCCL